MSETKVCKIHDAQMSKRWSDKKKKYYFAHELAGGRLCFGYEEGEDSLPQTREANEQKVDWDAKDRTSIAQTAYNAASTVVAALISTGKQVTGDEAVAEVEGMAKKIYSGILKARKGEWNGL